MAFISDLPNQASLLNGTADADEILGLNLDDTLNGNAGADTLDGGIGDDSVNGDAGDDIIVGGVGDDDNDGGADFDTLDFTSTGIAITLGGSGEIAKTVGGLSAGTDTIANIEKIVGDSTQVNAISGSLNASGNAAFAVDLFNNSLDVNIISGGLAPTTFSFEVENFSVVEGTENADVIVGDLNDNTFLGSLGDDLLNGFFGSNTLDYSALSENINFGDFSRTTIANPLFVDPITTPLQPEFITVDSALVFKDLGMMGQSVDGVTNIQTIIGGSGVNTIDGSINFPFNNTFDVDLSQNLLTVNVGGVDRTFTVVDFNNVIGTFNSDTIVGDDLDNVFGGSVGDDLLDGNGGTDTADYSDSGASIVLEATGLVRKGLFGLAGTDTLVDIERIVGDSTEVNTIDASSDDPNKAFIDVDLSTGELNINFIDPFIPVPGGTLTFEVENFQNVIGTDNSDTIVGDTAANTFIASGEFDFYDGGGEDIGFWNANDIGEVDTVDYSEIGTGITLGSRGIIVKEGLGVDTITNIERIIADESEGIVNTIDGSLEAGGNARLFVNLGEDKLVVEAVQPNEFFNEIDFEVIGFDNIVGTENGDVLAGDEQNNVFFGSMGEDLIVGNGEDSFFGEDSSIDTIDYSGTGFGVTLLSRGEIAKGPNDPNSIFNIISNEVIGEDLNAVIGENGQDVIRGIDVIIGDETQTNAINGVAQGLTTLGEDVGSGVRFEVDLENESLELIPVDTDFPGAEFTIVNFDDVTGTLNNDLIFGTTGKNTLNGDEGEDTLRGRKGKDKLDGGDGNDTVLGGNGKDALIGSEGDDDLRGGAGFDTAQYKNLGAGITLLSRGVIEKDGGLGTDTIQDIEKIVGDAGFINTIDGQDDAAGNAAFFVNLEEEILDVVLVAPEDNPLLGTTFSFEVRNFDNVDGTDNSDVIIGSSTDNEFGGSEGDDFLDGNGGFDTADYEDIDTSITLNAVGFVEKGALGTDLLVAIDEIIADSTFAFDNTIDASAGEISQVSVNLETGELEVALFTPEAGPLNFKVENFNNVVGSSNSDFLTGNGFDNTFFGSGGNDTIDGFSSFIWSLEGNTVDYSALDTSIVLGGSGEIVKEGLGTDTIANIDTIIGSATQTNTIDGALNAAGNAAFNVDLSLDSLEVQIVDPASVIFGTSFDFNVVNFDNVVGTVNDDSIFGNDDDNVIGGSAGFDVIDGKDGFDTLDYSALGAGITVAATGFIRKGFLGGLGEDNFSNIEAIIGDESQVNVIDGDTAFEADASLDVDLSAGTLIVNIPSLGQVGPIFIENFDVVFGGDQADTITGDSDSNLLDGADGDDVLSGRGGNDDIFGDEGNDVLSGGTNNDLLVGGNGSDVLDGGRGIDELIGVGSDLGATDVDQLTGGANSDLFVLGDFAGAFYEGIGFAQILDFETGIDTIQLNGVASDYTFNEFNTAISLNGDLIATTNAAFNIDTDFSFV